jgi:hypothetical protein
MHATIAVKQCIGNQARLAGIEGSKAKSYRYPGCQDCPTGKLARRGKLNDDDLMEIFKALEGRAHPPAEVLPQTVGTAERQPKEEAVKEQEKPKEKRCVRCGQTKPLEAFCKDRKAFDGHKSYCLACNRIVQNEFARKLRESKKAEAAELERMRHDARLIEDHAEAARQRMEEQAEPTPARESTAPTCLHEEPDTLSISSSWTFHATRKC